MLSQKGQGWVRLWTFFIVGQCGSYYAAYPRLGLSGITPVRRRIETLQCDLGGVALVVGERDGITFTAAGFALLEFLQTVFGDEE
jgi:DNA-binding transcriptional LysR family regulator